MKLVTLIGLIICLTVPALAKIPAPPKLIALTLKSNVGQTALSKVISTSKTFSAGANSSALQFKLEAPGSVHGLGAIMGVTKQQWGCGERYSAFMNSDTEEIFFSFDDFSPSALHALCKYYPENFKKEIGTSRLVVTVLEKITGNTSVSVFEAK